MADEKVAPLGSAVPEDALPDGDAPFKTVVEDEGSEKFTEALEESKEELGEGSEEAETSDAAEESSTSEKKTDEREEDEVSKILKSADKKDNVQKRIDQLTARLKTLEEENQKLKTQPSEKKDKVDPEYTEAQLKHAMKKAIEEGDHDLMFEIMEYREKRLEKSLVKRYEEAENAKLERQNQIDGEWKKVQTDYKTTWQDEQGKEIYNGAKRDLDLSHGDSLLYKVAYDLFNMQDEKGNFPYRVPGGQRMAVADALAAILKQKRLSPQDGKVKKLERSLSKERRKKGLSGSGSIEEDAPSRRPQTSDDTLAEVLEERQKYQTERGL